MPVTDPKNITDSTIISSTLPLAGEAYLMRGDDAVLIDVVIRQLLLQITTPPNTTSQIIFKLCTVIEDMVPNPMLRFSNLLRIHILLNVFKCYTFSNFESLLQEFSLDSFLT